MAVAVSAVVVAAAVVEMVAVTGLGEARERTGSLGFLL